MTPSRAYVIRIWYEPGALGAIWQASATDVQTQPKHYFKSQQELGNFLKNSSTDTSPSSQTPHEE